MMAMRYSLVLTVLVGWGTGLAAVEPDTIRLQDPDLGSPVVRASQARFHPGLLPLWLEALARPENDLKRQVADAITKAQSLGMPGLEESIPQLTRELQSESVLPPVRLSVARALIAVEARDSAALLMDYAKSAGADAAQVVEPALARWNYGPIQQVWLDRLADSQTPRGPLLLAIQGAVIVKLVQAIPHLRQRVVDTTVPSDIRLTAARAIAVMQPSGMEDEARQLATDPSPKKMLERLLAATLLSQHQGNSAESILVTLSRDQEPAVAAIAARRLVAIAPQQLSPLLADFSKSPDAVLRTIAAETMASLHTVETATSLTQFLDDRDRDLRNWTQSTLVRLASEHTVLSDPIKEATFTLLPTARQNGQEQAALVLGALRHEPAAQRLLPLLKAPRAQTRRAASWALRCLAAPSTADAILQHLQVETGKLHGLRSDEIDIEVCADLEHLIEALGVMKHRPATALLMKYLPPPPPVIPPELEGSKPVWLPHLRSAAIWSLGQIHATTPGKEVISGLQSRLRSADVTTVRTMAAVGLGRMHTKSASKELRNLLDDSFEEIEVRRASAWALEQIEGQSSEMPAYPDMAMERWYTGWFLEPTTAVPKKR